MRYKPLHEPAVFVKKFCLLLAFATDELHRRDSPQDCEKVTAGGRFDLPSPLNALPSVYLFPPATENLRCIRVSLGSP